MKPWPWILAFADRERQRTSLCRLAPVPSSRRVFLSLLVLVCALASAAATLATSSHAYAATPAKTLVLTYDVYAGGLHAFTFDLNLTLAPTGYRIAAAGATRGMIGLFYDWKVRLSAEGKATTPASGSAGEHLRPQRYMTVNSGRHEPKTMQLAFGTGGSYSIRQEPPQPAGEVAEDRDLPSTLPADIVDPLSAALVATQTLAQTGRCEQAIPVFDGKRRYNLLIRDAGAGQVPKSRYSAYDGPAVLCGFTMQRVSGFKQKRRYASQWDEDKDAPPTLWVARVRDDLPPVPVRFTGAIALGNIVIHLSKFEPGTELASVESR